MDSIQYAQAQDELRPFRMFVGALNGALLGSTDQSWAGLDNYGINSPYRYQTVGPYAVGIEGAGGPLAATAGGGVYISPMLVMIAIGAAAVLLLKN